MENNPVPIQTTQSTNPGVSYREVYDVINSNALSALLSVLLCGLFVMQISRKIIKTWLSSDLLRTEIPTAVDTVNDVIPALPLKLDRIQSKIEAVHEQLEEIRRDIKEGR
jgi:hypothetical protein